MLDHVAARERLEALLVGVLNLPMDLQEEETVVVRLTEALAEPEVVRWLQAIISARDKWFRKAFAGLAEDGTYELVGPKSQGETRSMIEIDDDGYPTEDSLERIRALRDDWPASLRCLVDEIPEAIERMGYGRSEQRREGGELVIELATGGWSGCEELIGAILSLPAVRMVAYSAWRRGGWHEFRIAEGSRAREAAT